YWVVKLDGTGAIQWQKLLGGSSPDEGYAIQQTSDGGYILFGYSQSSTSGDVTGTNHGSDDYWVVKLSGTGATQWQQLLGGSGRDSGQSVQQTLDGGYILFGYSQSSASGDITGSNHGGIDYWVVKLDGTGAIQWQTLLGGSSSDEGTAIRQTPDGGYILVGYSESSASGNVLGTNHGGYDCWVVKLDDTGAIQWQELAGGSGYDLGSSVQLTADGGYILVGYSQSSASGDITGTNHGFFDAWIVKLKAAPGIRLGPGWNFVSVPAVLAAGSDTASIFAGVNTGGHSIFLYNATAKAWAPMTATTKVKPLDGIWIYSSTAITIPLSFDSNPLVGPPEKALAAGWNAIGYSSASSMSARDALLSVVSKWSTLIGFDPAAQQYEAAIINGGSGPNADSRPMEPGRGYWLSMREAGQLTAVGVGP
ncbi:MAG: hypothetical protein ABFC89_09450, partial [Methanospirillum sp.]